MKRYIFALIFSANLLFYPAYAEKIPVRIAPIQIISTHHDEVEIGDNMYFEVANDVYKNNSLYIKKGTNVAARVEFLHPNGWLGDSAEIKFDDFITTDVHNNKVNIKYPMVLNGNIILKNESKQSIAYLFTFLVRGSEIYVEPDTKAFNIFINQ